MIRIEYCEEGQAISDFGIDEFILKAYEANESIKVSTENVLYKIRALAAKGTIDYSQVFLVYKEQEMTINPCGRINIDTYPKGFMDLVDDCLDVMLGI